VERDRAGALLRVRAGGGDVGLPAGGRDRSRRRSLGRGDGVRRPPCVRRGRERGEQKDDERRA
jgi:hypothetical protein